VCARGGTKRQVNVSNHELTPEKFCNALCQNAARIQTISPGQGFGVLIVEIKFIITVLGAEQRSVTLYTHQNGSSAGTEGFLCCGRQEQREGCPLPWCPRVPRSS
jgi:hypothetical protein